MLETIGIVQCQASQSLAHFALLRGMHVGGVALVGGYGHAHVVDAGEHAALTIAEQRP